MGCIPPILGVAAGFSILHVPSSQSWRENRIAEAHVGNLVGGAGRKPSVPHPGEVRSPAPSTGHHHFTSMSQNVNAPSAKIVRLKGANGLAPAEAMGYVLSLAGVSTVIIGCSSPDEVDQNAAIARAFRPFDAPALRAFEPRTGRYAGVFTSDKRP